MVLAGHLMASEEQHAAAFIAALNALGAVAYDYDDVPATLPAFYTIVTVSRRFGGNRRGEGVPTVYLYRATTRAVARTVGNAREMRRRAHLIEGVSLTVAGEQTTPVEFETAQIVGPDENYYSGLTTWVWAL